MYGLPPDPVVTTRDLPSMWRHAGAAAAGLVAAAAAAFAAERLGRRGSSTADVTGQGPRGERPGREARPGRRARRRGRRGERPMVPPAEFTSYYGKPVLNPPVWEAPDIAGYLFLGGLAGASSLLGAGAQLTGRPGLARAAKTGALGAIACPWPRWCTTSDGRPGSSTCCACSR